MHHLLSLPPCSIAGFREHYNRAFPEWIASCDPDGTKLGSGGGCAHLLEHGWRASGKDLSFGQWLKQSRKIIIHAGGQSRRLPAYALTGKTGIPVPVMRGIRGQRLDQTLLDMQEDFFRDLAPRISRNTVAMVASGDVLLSCSMSKLPSFPDADVVLIGLWAEPETAQNHGVFFCDRTDTGNLVFIHQKPSVAQIRQHAGEFHFLVDSGLWLFSERAVSVLMAKCGWDSAREAFSGSIASAYDLYGGFSQSLGKKPLCHVKDISSLTCAVAALPDGEFFHFGTNRDLIRSCAQLSTHGLSQKDMGSGWIKPHAEMFVLNASKKSASLTSNNRLLWIENAAVSDTWQLESEHVITGVPENNWSVALPKGMCLDFVPIDSSAWCIRVYGFDDRFSGAFGDLHTLWCGQPAMAWLSNRGIAIAEAGIDPASDIQSTLLFPVVIIENDTGDFIQWLLDPSASRAPDACRRKWLSSERLSADQLGSRANLRRLFSQRRAFACDALPGLARNASRNVFYLLDLDHTARQYAVTPHSVEQPETDAGLISRIHHSMFRAAVARYRNEADWQQPESLAFALLREAFVASAKDKKIAPVCAVQEDQIVWARSPLRIDLAGGWTDTPPFCLLRGGHVINVAVNLNGQPPVQVFARKCDSPELVIRSIDLGVEERIRSFEELAAFAGVGSAFSVAKAAFCLAGFEPAFSGAAHASLKDALADFGGGIELSLLAAVPKGSGMGTSSILAATIFGALSDLCGLGWDHAEIYRRVLVLEQMLTAGGGWQDQVGGVSRGLKYIQTSPGLDQSPQVRWLPDHLFTDPEACQCMLLYYTGVTRVAKNILQEIVRGMFLNRKATLSVLERMILHAGDSYDMLIRGSYDGLCHCVKRSWILNQELDSGTNPPSVQAILDAVSDLCAAAKLPGAGGGGYLFMLAKDPQAASRIRRMLNDNPPNPKARFVECLLSNKGMEVTRS